MERPLLVALILVAVLAGTAAALLRPAIFRLGQEGAPRAGSGVTYGGIYRGGRWLPRAGGRGEWTRFKGRGPGGAK
jgi:hypothetical protein